MIFESEAYSTFRQARSKLHSHLEACPVACGKFERLVMAVSCSTLFKILYAGCVVGKGFNFGIFIIIIIIIFYYNLFNLLVNTSQFLIEMTNFIASYGMIFCCFVDILLSLSLYRF